MEFEKTIKINAEDLYHFYLAVVKKAFIYASIIVFFATLAICLNEVSNFLLSVMLSVIIVCIIVLLAVLFLKRNVKKTYATDRIIRLPQKIKLDNIGLHTSSEVDSSSVPWGDFSSVKESKYGFYFILNSRSGYIIPKRLLEPDEMVTIRSIKIKKSPDKETSLGDEY